MPLGVAISYFRGKFHMRLYKKCTLGKSCEEQNLDLVILYRVSNVKMQSQHFLVMTVYNC